MNTEHRTNLYGHLKTLQDYEIQGTGRKELLTAINSLEKARISMYGIMDNYLKAMDIVKMLDIEGEREYVGLTAEDVNKFRLKNWKVEEYDNKIVLETDHIPMNLYSKSIMHEFLQEQQFIKESTIKLLKPIAAKYNFSKVFVMYNLISPSTQYDVDNRFFKPYNDGIVSAKLIPCDSISYLAYGFMGTYSVEEFKLRITIKDYSEVQRYLE